MHNNLSDEEQDALFQEILRKIPSVHHPDKLEELALLALSLTVRRADSQALREQLAREIKTVIAGVKPGDTPERIGDEMRLAARSCIQVLRSAKERRQPRPPGERHGVEDLDSGHAHSPPVEAQAEERSNRRIVLMVVASALTLVAVAAAAWWNGRDGDGNDPNQTTRFIEQITAAAQGGDVPATHLFGGKLTAGSMGGVPVVTAEAVPPRICAASGMRLVKKGLLGVNGVTPTRVSSAIITDLCNKEEGGATMMWAPNKP